MLLPLEDEQTMIAEGAQEGETREVAIEGGGDADQRAREVHVGWGDEESNADPAGESEVGGERFAQLRYGGVVDGGVAPGGGGAAAEGFAWREEVVERFPEAEAADDADGGWGGGGELG